MLVYYINLEKRADRRKAMEARLGRLGLSAERIVAVTPDDLGPDDAHRYCDIQNHFYLAPVELCCSLSHVAAMRRFLETDEQFCLILEDDAVLSSKLPAFLADFEKAAQTVDIVRLETDCSAMRLSPAADFAVGGVHAYRFHSWCAGAAGYIISRAGAATLAASDELRIKQTDRVMFNPYEPMARQLIIRQADPALVIQEHHLATSAETSVSDLAVARDKRDVIDNSLTRGRLWFRMLDFLDRDLRIAALKLWHQSVGRAAKRQVPFVH